MSRFCAIYSCNKPYNIVAVHVAVRRNVQSASGLVHAVVSQKRLKNLTLRRFNQDVTRVRVFSKKQGVTTPDCSGITLVGYAKVLLTLSLHAAPRKLHRTLVQECRCFSARSEMHLAKCTNAPVELPHSLACVRLCYHMHRKGFVTPRTPSGHPFNHHVHSVKLRLGACSALA